MVTLTANLLQHDKENRQVIITIPDKIYVVGSPKQTISVRGDMKLLDCEDSWWPQDCTTPEITVTLELHENFNGIIKHIEAHASEKGLAIQFHKNNRLLVSVIDFPPNVMELNVSKEF